ncbi:MAG: PD40 domain-containing protein [Phycisphaerae bacterium]|nr:PD40 domain-containing protein [Phycisphaerae bacterium]
MSIISPLQAGAPIWHQATAMPFGFAVFEPSASADGRFVAFRSAFNFTGENADANFEIMLFDRELGTVAQLTNTTAFYGNFEPGVTPDGDAVIFRSAFNFTGTNADGSFEVFEIDVATGAVSQLTFTPGNAILAAPRLSSDGACVVYQTSQDGTMDVWRYRRADGQTIAVTNSMLGKSATAPVVNGDGTRIAFLSNNNFDGSNPDSSIEVWRWTQGFGFEHVTQTTPSAQNEFPGIDAGGEHVSFISRANLAGENPAFTREIFVCDLSRRGRMTFAQATPSVVGGKNLEPVLSPDGAFVVFESDRDPIGENPDKNRELFRYDLALDALTQVTISEYGAPIALLSDAAAKNYICVSGDSQHIAYRSEHELDPEADDPAPDANLELFVAAITPALLGDLDEDGEVDELDLGICLGEWGTLGSFADLDGDGFVGPTDVAILLGAWS